MNLLFPIGLITLVALLVLLLIYLIKPNYQTKYISSTYIWKLSLKYKKRKLPINKLRNILLIICQCLIISIIAMIVSTPIIKHSASINKSETILIIDSSASMRTMLDDETRYEKAINDAVDLATDVFNKNELLTIILAENESKFLYERVDSSKKDEVLSKLKDLISTDETKCSYGSCDVNEAITMISPMLEENPSAKLYLYTDSEYVYLPDNINVTNYADKSEWNAAIIDASAQLNENYYDIIIDIASYGRDENLGINIQIEGVNPTDTNPDGETIRLSSDMYQVRCENDNVTKVFFKSSNLNEEDENTFDISNYSIYSFREIGVYLDENINDSFALDNSYHIYGGEKETIRIQYSSTLPNKFVNSAILNLIDKLEDDYAIELVEEKNQTPALSGFDYYIFEHYAPEKLPTDGVCILLDPNLAPTNSGFVYLGDYNNDKVEIPLTLEVDTDPLMKNVNIDDVTVTRFSKVQPSADYKVLATCNNYPVLMYKNSQNSKIFVMNFSVHYSSIVLTYGFPLLFRNFVTEFSPKITDKNLYDVYDDITINQRGRLASVTKDTNKWEYDNLPYTFKTTEPGTYEIIEVNDFDETMVDNVYVRIPNNESNIFMKYDDLYVPVQHEVEKDIFDDLMIYFAIALVVLLLAEWWLKSRESV